MSRIGFWLGRSALLTCVFILPARAQTPTPTPTPVAKSTSSAHKLESDFFKNIILDQKAIWTSPLHIHHSDWKWLGPYIGGTAALVATDESTSGWVDQNGSLHGFSRVVSWNGSVYATAGVAAGMWAIGRSTHNDHLRETGLLAGEALINTGILTEAAKLVFGRERPNLDAGEGSFFRRGSSFFSGHASSSWAVATVVACEYRDRPLAVWGAYGLATAVSLSRYSGRNHFLSDILIGAGVGYGIGRYVCRERAKFADDDNNNTVSHHWRISLYLNARTATRGGSFVWQF